MDDNIFNGTKEQRKELAAYYTPNVLVKKMYNEGDNEKDSLIHNTILDPSCGSGNILIEGLNRKLKEGEKAIEAISEIFGIEIDKDTYNNCMERLLKWASINGVDKQSAEYFLKRHIVNADALTYDYSFGEKEFKFGNIKSAQK